MSGRRVRPIAEPLRTDRLDLEPLRVDHAAEMEPVLVDTALYEFMGGHPPDAAELAARYRMQVAGPIDTDERWLNWVVRRRIDGTAVGFVQATVVGSTADVAWVIAVRHQGQGYAPEAGRAMIATLADQGVTAFEAHIHAAHRASQRVAEMIGFERTGATDDDGEEIWAVIRSARGVARAADERSTR